MTKAHENVCKQCAAECLRLRRKVMPQSKKAELKTAIKKLIGRSLTKDDIVLDFSEVEDGTSILHQATVILADEPYNGMAAAYSGDLCDTQKDAETSACEVALEALRGANPELAKIAPNAIKRKITEVQDNYAKRPKDGGFECWKRSQPSTVLQLAMAKRSVSRLKAAWKTAQVGDASIPDGDPDYADVEDFAFLDNEAESDGAAAPRIALLRQESRSTSDMAQARAEPADDPKVQLSLLLSKLLRVQLQREDLCYEVQKTAMGNWCATVSHSKPQGYTGPCRHKGGAFSKRQDAEFDAAAKAIEALQEWTASQRTMDMGDDVWRAYIDLRDTRLDFVSPREVDSQAMESFDLWFGQVCLCCLAVVAGRCWPAHVTSSQHRTNFRSQPLRLKSDQSRLDLAPCLPLMPSELFLEVGGWAEVDTFGSAPAVLTLGEMDYSFSLALARLRPAGSPLVATSYLQALDGWEPEVHPTDDVERATFERSSLPAMNGALQDNMDALLSLGAEIRHGVDATSLRHTLRSKGIEGGFQYIVFPCPSGSLNRGSDARHSRLIMMFFQSVANDGVMLEGGIVQLVLFNNQFEEWDVASIAASAGFALHSRAEVPPDFYQAREVSGRKVALTGAELLCFVFESRAA